MRDISAARSPEADLAARSAFDAEAAFVDHPMVLGAKLNKVGKFSWPTACPMLDVVGV